MYDLEKSQFGYVGIFRFERVRIKPNLGKTVRPANEISGRFLDE